MSPTLNFNVETLCDALMRHEGGSWLSLCLPATQPYADTGRRPSLNQEDGSSPDTESACSLILNFPPSRTVREKCVKLPAYAIWLQQPKLPNNVEKDERNRDRVVRHTLGEDTIWREFRMRQARDQCRGIAEHSAKAPRQRRSSYFQTKARA